MIREFRHERTLFALCINDSFVEFFLLINKQGRPRWEMSERPCLLSRFFCLMYFIFRPDDDRFFAVCDDAAHPNDGEEGEKNHWMNETALSWTTTQNWWSGSTELSHISEKSRKAEGKEKILHQQWKNRKNKYTNCWYIAKLLVLQKKVLSVWQKRDESLFVIISVHFSRT